jgi:dTDP-glucose pyrophosphorylase
MKAIILCGGQGTRLTGIATKQVAAVIHEFARE